MTCLVMCNRFLFLRSYDLALPFQTSDDSIDGVEEILFVYGLLVMSCCCECSLVADIGYIGT